MMCQQPTPQYPRFHNRYFQAEQHFQSFLQVCHRLIMFLRPLKGTLCLNKLFKGPANFAKSFIKTRQTPIVPRNIRTSETFLQADHRSMTPTLSTAGILPQCTSMPNHGDFLCTQCALYPERYHRSISSVVLPVNILEMFPDKSSDSFIFRNPFTSSIF